jgi:TonB-linked SusC/RagA family outer membrane protein
MLEAFSDHNKKSNDSNYVESKTYKFMKNKLILKFFSILGLKQLKRLILIMKLTALLSLLAVINLTASVYSQKKEISIQVENIQLRDLFREIENNSEYAFFFNDQYAQLENKVSVKMDNEKIENILDNVLKNTSLDYKILDNNFVVIIAKESMQEIKVQGVVTDADGTPLPGVNVIEKGTMNGTITDADGNYSLNVESTDAVLVFSFIGYLSEEVTVGAQESVNVSLIQSIEALEEVVVIGYGIQKKSVVTGAIAKVSTDIIERSSDLRIEQVLQGRTAGVMIMSNSGQPGDNLTIRIRGVGTNSNPDPLFLVDGLPLQKEGLDYLNPTDVESVEVLKDASAAAIYGTRGANGVILITTKQGKVGKKPEITYESYYCVQNPWRKMDMLNASQYIDIINEAGENDGRSTPYFTDAVIDTMHYDTDWQDEMFYENAPKMSHKISISGGSEKSAYYSSLSYYSQDGLVAEGKSNFKRLNYRINSSHELGRVTVSNNINIVSINKKGVDANNQYGFTGINQAMNMPPIVPVKYNDGSWAVPTDYGMGVQEITNPLAMLDVLNRAEKTNKILGNVSVDLRLIKGLVFRTNFSAEYAYVTNDEYVPVYFIDATHRNNARGDSSDYVTKEIHKYMRWNLDNTLSYTKTLGNHNMTALIGMTRFREWDEGVYGKKYALIFDDFEHAYLDNAVRLDMETSGKFVEHTLASTFARLNYNYKEKYLLEGVLRIDGSSRFGSASRYGKFPAVSAGWVISREGFFPTNNVLNFLKIRASWGKNGSENIPDFRYIGLMSNDKRYYFGEEKTMYNGILPTFISNAGLKWEASEQLDIGADMALFAGRLTFAFDVYNKKTKDWLIQAPAPDLLGNNPPWVNGGDVQNKGIEMELGYKNNITKNLYINVLLTAATNKNEVLDIPNTGHVLMGGSAVHGQGNVLRAVVGTPMGYFYGYKTAGIIQTEEQLAEVLPLQKNAKLGDMIFVDVNGDDRINDNDKTDIGNPYPKITSGCNITIGWKGIDLYMFWYSALGHQIIMANRRSDLKFVNFTTDVLDRWHGEGTSTDEPRVSIADNNKNYKVFSDYYVKDADFLRLKVITLGYTVPVKLTSAVKINKLRFYVSSENLLTFTKYPGMEVEVGGTPFGADDANGNATNPIGVDHGIYPQAKTYLAGVSITF